MTSVLAIVAAVTITGGSLSPQEAKARTADASRREAVKVCAVIEKELGEHYTGGNFSATFDAVHPFTAHYVGEHFRDHWRIRWNDWYSEKWPGGVIVGPDAYKPHDTRIDRGVWANPRVVDGKKWKIDLSPRDGG